MKYWLSRLPLEVWVEVFCYPWISREKLGQIVDRFRNRKFAEYLQFYLHDWGKQKLRGFFFGQHGLFMYGSEPGPTDLDIPPTPKPNNIKCFSIIVIQLFNIRTLAFLDKIRALLVDVQLCLTDTGWNDFAELRAIFTHLLPMLNGIRSVDFSEDDISFMEEQFGVGLAQIRVIRLHLHYRSRSRATVNFLVNRWLATAGPDWHGAKLCALENCSIAMLDRIEDEIYEQFTAATSPCTFRIDIKFREEDDEEWLRGFQHENALGEQLVGWQWDQGEYAIARFQAKDYRQLEDWVEQNLRKCRRCISFRHAAYGKLNGMPNNEDEDHQAPASKKRRLSI